MKTTTKTLLIIAAVFMFAMLLVSCAPAAPAATTAPAATSAPADTAAPAATVAIAAPADTAAPAAPGKKILRVAYTREPDVLNAFTSQELCDIEFTMVEGLIQNNDKGENIPVLAKQIPTLANGGIVQNADGTVDMTWPLQQGVKWSDGQPFTSKDVCFTWKFASDPNSQTYNSTDYQGIKDCKMPDDNTVVFHWDKLHANYAGIFEAVLPEHLLGKLTIDQIVKNDAYNRSPIGTGPYMFAEWKSGEYIRVVKNPNYWRGADYPKMDEIVFSFIPDDNTRENALKTGQYDIGEILPLQVKDFKDNTNGTVKLINSNTFLHLDLNNNSPRTKALFGDIKVRQALFHAIDRQAIADQLMEGTVTVINTSLNPTGVWVNKSVTTYDYNVDMAKKMLDEAGWVPGADGIRVKNGQRFSFVMLNRAGKQDRIAVAQVIQSQFKEIGVEVTFQSLEAAAWATQWRTGTWDAIVSGWFLASDPSLTAIYACKGSNNFTGFCDPKLDDVMNQSDVNIDFAKRKPLMDQVQSILADDAFTLPIYAQVTPMYLSNNLTGFLGSGTNLGSYWNVFEWGLK